MMSSISKQINIKEIFKANSNNNGAAKKSIFSKIILFPFILLLLILSCKESPTTPNDQIKPPGYQEDIPWPSLADSPWPRYHGNAQNNGRTFLNGPTVGNLFKSINIERINSGIVVGPDSAIYFATSYPGYLYSLTKVGNENWKIRLTDREIESTPVVGNDGTIYVGLFQEKKLVAVSANGTVKWALNTGAIVQLGISVGTNGTIYFIYLDRYLNAVDKNGNVLWKLFNTSFGNVGTGNTAMSPDGKVIYIGSRYKLFAIDVSSQSILWTFEETQGSTVLVDTKGNIYCVAKDTSQSDKPVYFFSLNQNGSIRWKYKLDGWISYSGQDAAMDINGNIYFASDTVYSLDYNGNLRWKKFFNNENFPTPFVCDGSGKIYSTSQSDFDLRKTIYCFDSNGNVIWSLSYYIQGLIYWSPSIGFDNTLYVPINSDSSKILIIK